jgi:hypothetical protein
LNQTPRRRCSKYKTELYSGHEGIVRVNSLADSWLFYGYYLAIHKTHIARTTHFADTERGVVKKRVCVIDGQGGGIGSTLIKYLKSAYGEQIELIALGTNAIAASQMLRAGANRCASGENAICRTAAGAHCIVGPVSITWANAMLGEVTPKMAEAVTTSPAFKLLLPLFQENAEIIGVSAEPLPHLVQTLVEKRLMEVLDHV